MPRVRAHSRAALLPIAVIVAAFFACAALYSVVIPVWEGPDEPEHFVYIRYLVQEHALPTSLPSYQPDGNNEAKQAPLYYLLAAPMLAGLDLDDADRIRMNPHTGWVGSPDASYATVHVLDEGWPYHGVFQAAHRVRLLSVLLGAVTVALTYAIAVQATGRRREGIVAAVLVACLPGLLFASSTISNDALADTFGAALLWLALRCRERCTSARLLAFGGVGALALLTKLSLVLPVGLCLLALAVWAERDRLRTLVLAGLPMLPAGVFWAWRVAQGERQLVGRALAWPPSFARSGATLSWAAPLEFVRHVWVSFFGLFGWTGHELPLWLYALYSLVFAAGLLAAALPIGPRDSKPRLRGGALLWALPAVFLAGMAAAAISVTSGLTYDASRLLYPALPAIAVLVAHGWSRLARAWAMGRRLITVALALDAVAALAIPPLALRPYLPVPWPVSNQIPAAATPVAGATFVAGVALVGTELPATTVGAGQGVFFTFYWRVAQPLPEQEWLFVHVQDSQGRLAAAFDGQPKAPALPLALWRSGDVVQEREVLTIHQDAAAGAYTVLVGWYDHQSGARLALASGGTEATAGHLTITSAP